MDNCQQRRNVEARRLKRRLPAVLLAALLTAPFGSACSSNSTCDSLHDCASPDGRALAGASGSSSGVGGGGTGPLGSAGGVSVSNPGGAGASGGASLAGGTTGGAFTAGGAAQGGVSGSAGGGGASNAGAATGGKSNGGAGAGGTLGTAGSGGSNGNAGSGGKAGSASTAGAAGTSTAGSSGSGGSGSVDPYASARQTCVDRVNTLRATKGLGPIPRLPSAEDCADNQAKKDSQSGVAHSAFGDCVNEVQGWTGAAQNECPGYGSVASTLSTCIDQMWAEGPGGGHYDNMVSDSDFIACGFYTTPNGKVWMIQDFWSK